ncbi:Carbonic anhydrase OS=Streptomyces albaduncus OX=68172 GN=FHS32_005263 PE=3 SV=1 [Streptomyces griseoloalbus]
MHVRGQLTFLAVPRLSRALHLVPQGADAVVALDGSFMDHAAYETLQDWQGTHTARGGTVDTGRRTGVRIAEPGDLASGPAPGGESGTHGDCRCRPWTAWRNHQCDRPSPAPDVEPLPDEASRERREDPGPARNRTPGPDAPRAASNWCAGSARSSAGRPVGARRAARLAREAAAVAYLRPVVTSITSSGPGDLFVVRNVGNLVPPPGAESGDDSVAAAIEYAVDVLAVRSITVCGHSGCGAMQALLDSRPASPAATPLGRWLRHGGPSLERLRDTGAPAPRLAGRAPPTTSSSSA